MAASQQSPYLKKPNGPFSTDDGTPTPAIPRPSAPNMPNQPASLPTVVVRPSFMDKLAAGPGAFGGLPNTPDKGSPMALADAQALTHPSNVLGIPTGYGAGVSSGTSAPATPAVPIGTRIGKALGSANDAAGTLAAGAINDAAATGANVLNKITLPLRYGAGLGQDISNAYNGQPARPGAGQAVAGITAPQVPANLFARSAPTDPASAVVANAGDPNDTTGTPQDQQAVLKVLSNISNIARGTSDTQAQTQAPASTNRGVVPNNGAPAVPAAAGGVDIGGRHLNVGAMVNGVPTFSDGTGTGGIPRTMSDKQIKGYGDNVSRADAGALSNVLASDVTGGPTSTADHVNQLVSSANVPITGSRPTAQQFADADRINIATRDPRSAGGTAAHNLAIDAQYGSPRLRRLAETALAQMTAGANQGGLSAQQAEQQQAAIGAQGQNELANTTLRGQNALQAIQLQGGNELANTALTSKIQKPTAGQLVQSPDGSYTLVNPITAATTAVHAADGSPLKGQLKNPPAPIYTTAGGSAMLTKMTDQFLGVNPLTGMIDDAKAPNGQRLPTPCTRPPANFFGKSITP
ncbi:MAG: hypothetical protein ABIY56_01705 [Dokdonella sp.]